MSSVPSLSASDWKSEGNEAFKRAQYDKAVVCYSEAIGLSEGDEALFSNRAAALMKLKKYSEALEDAKKCVELKPDWSKGRYRLALSYSHLGKVTEAAEELKKSLELDPTNEDIKYKLEELQTGKSPAGRPQKDQQVAQEVQIPSCQNCGKSGKTSKLFQCGKCLKVSYCSKECQVTHWRIKHKSECAN